MTNPTRNFVQPKGRWPNVALRCLLLVGAILVPGTLPGIVLQSLSECEVPLDEKESSEEVVARVQSGTLLHNSRRPHAIWRVAVDEFVTLPFAINMARVSDGHRLSNNLMAPLRL